MATMKHSSLFYAIVAFSKQARPYKGYVPITQIAWHNKAILDILEEIEEMDPECAKALKPEYDHWIETVAPKLQDFSFLEDNYICWDHQKGPVLATLFRGKSEQAQACRDHVRLTSCIWTMRFTLACYQRDQATAKHWLGMIGVAYNTNAPDQKLYDLCFPQVD